ncbi:MAG: excinuclease ABC subunit UvrB [Pseudoflavonifractor sp.]|nr:excinuclease ABC subunit UvrB [Alloprevotella sp.]MCM1117675.1 excinuclease ABC subunit UvrB [Pseudoflavonifractor sp.]
MSFKIHSDYQPTGDQPQAIEQLTRGVLNGLPAQTLLGVTGSGKTFTMANLIERVDRPTLILSHNKTLAAQLFSEMKGFFPDNSVQYFVSYYDYYQPEAYIPSVDKYIEKDLMINDEIERLRLATTSALLSGRKDVIVVSSVSCLYGMGNPEDFNANVVALHVGQKIHRNALLRSLVDSLYSRNEVELGRGTFRVKGDTVDIYLAYEEIGVRVMFWSDEIESISTFYPADNVPLGKHDSFNIYPANLFVTSPMRMAEGLTQIAIDLGTQAVNFEMQGKLIEAQRLRERVTYDMEMMREVGHCPGIENYSRYFDGREKGARPFCLLDYFPRDFLTIIDESHVTIPQIRAMFGGDLSRKNNLVDYGFRLDAALDNRPLKFEEFKQMTGQTIYVSATPADYELQESEGVVVEQIIRPTGLLDPIIEVRPSLNQIDDLMEEIALRRDRGERTLVTTLTKRMAEELNDYLIRLQVKAAYIHSDVDTIDRIRILDDLRAGVYDVLIGVNLLREGLDLPEVSLVAILDADKEGFLRSHRSLTQTVGRAARNLNGMVIMYADKITDSMQLTIDETERRRAIQLEYNESHGITPTAIVKARQRIIGMDQEEADARSGLSPAVKDRFHKESPAVKAAERTIARARKEAAGKPYPTYENEFSTSVDIAADPVIPYMNAADLERSITRMRQQMVDAAKQMEFMEAARLRDEIVKMEALLKQKKSETAQD